MAEMYIQIMFCVVGLETYISQNFEFDLKVSN